MKLPIFYGDDDGTKPPMVTVGGRPVAQLSFHIELHAEIVFQRQQYSNDCKIDHYCCSYKG